MSPIEYIADSALQAYFFTPNLKRTVNLIQNTLELSSQHRIMLFTDATLKTNKLPTGMAIVSRAEDAFLFPYLLRDPGCGYINFGLKGIDPFDTARHQHISHKILEWCDHLTRGDFAEHPQFGVRHYLDCLWGDFQALNPADRAHISKPSRITSEISINPEHLNALALDFHHITNTLELKYAYAPLNKMAPPKALEDFSIFGFIHAGSHYNVRALAHCFHPLIQAEALASGRFIQQQVIEGIYGIPLDSPLGIHYHSALLFVMNYCVLKRYNLFLMLKDFLEKEEHCEVTLINEATHAGVLNSYYDENCFISSRGVQRLHLANAGEVTLLAGQRESLSAFVTPGIKAQNYEGLFAHGTSYQDTLPPEHVSDDIGISPENSIALSARCLSNTQKNAHHAHVFNFNLIKSLAYYQEIQLIDQVFFLAPWLNFQSVFLSAS